MLLWEEKNGKLFTYSQTSKIYFSVLDAGKYSTLYQKNADAQSVEHK